MFNLCNDIVLLFPTRRVVCWEVPSALPLIVIQIQNLRSAPDLLSQSLHFNNISLISYPPRKDVEKTKLDEQQFYSELYAETKFNVYVFQETR